MTLGLKSQNHGAIVGAGSVALLAAGWLASNFGKMTIYESTKSIGGVTGDISATQQGIFFAGCHYLESRYLPPGFDYSGLLRFEHRYSSLTDHGKGFTLKNGFAGPSFPESWFDFSGANQSSYQLDVAPGRSVGERLKAYPRPIADRMARFIRRFYPDESWLYLSTSSLGALGLSRVTTQGDESWMASKKQDSILFDEIFGVSRSALGLSPEWAFIPKFGFSDFWDNFSHQLKDFVDLDFRFSTRVNRPTLLSELNSAPSQLKIWTADPRFPVRHVTGSRLTSLSYKKYLTGVRLSSFNGPTLPHYINVFETTEGITRLYFYQLGSELKMTIESLAAFQDLGQLKSSLSTMLEAAGIELTIPFQELASLSSRQYFPMLESDQKLLKITTRCMENRGWLAPGLDLFDRRARMRSLMDSLSRAGMLDDKSLEVDDPLTLRG